MSRHLHPLIFCLVIVSCQSGTQEQLVAPETAVSHDDTVTPLAGDGWVTLFDGKTLDGWTPKIRGHALGEDPYQTFRVEDGSIRIGYENYGGKFAARYGHLFYDIPLSRYLLRVEYRFFGEQMEGGAGWAWRNSGLMLHGQDPKTMAIDQEFPVSIEMQLLGGDGTNTRTNANLCTPGTNVVMGESLQRRHCINSTSETCHGDDWVWVTVEVRGGEVIRHFLGDELVMEYTAPQLDSRDSEAQLLIKEDALLLTGGTLSLQSESHPLEFRRIEIKMLPDAP
ncbi:MAG: DUF1080 domain-containing protein [bacterium]